MCVKCSEVKSVDPLWTSSTGPSYICLLAHADRPSPLLLHWRRRFCLQLNEAWPLIDHVWSCTTPLVSVCSWLVCLFCPTVPIITVVISCMMRSLHASGVTALTSHRWTLESAFLLSASNPYFLIKCLTLWLFQKYSFLFLALSSSLWQLPWLWFSNTSRCCRHARLSSTALINNT